MPFQASLVRLTAFYIGLSCDYSFRKTRNEFIYFCQFFHQPMKPEVQRLSTLEILENKNEQVYALWVAVPRLSLAPIHLRTPDALSENSFSSLISNFNFQKKLFRLFPHKQWN